MFQAVTNKLQHPLLRVLVHKPTNSLWLLEHTGMMLTEEIECRAFKDDMLFISNMEKGNAGRNAAHVGCCHAARREAA